MFPWPTSLSKSTYYIKTNTVLDGLFKYSCIRIDKNILRINSLFFYENQKFRPQGDPLYIFQIFSRVSKLNFSLFINTNTIFVLPSLGKKNNICIFLVNLANLKTYFDNGYLVNMLINYVAS